MHKWPALLFFISATALADPSASEKLDQTQKNLAETRAHALAVAQAKEKLADELKHSREDLVRLASDVQENESETADAEEKLALLNHERQARSAALETKRDTLNAMIAAAIRLSIAPPEAALAMPGDTGDALTAAHVLEQLARSIRQEADGIGAEMRELDRLSAKVERLRSHAAQTQNALKNKRLALESSLAQRQSLESKLARDQEDTRRRMESLSREAKSLQELMAKIESTHRAAPPLPKGKLRSLAAARGKLRMPASGRITQRFGEELGRNETSKGMVIATPGGASVVAPFDAEVVFTGPFLDYGKMVILRHADDFHTLLAGFDRVNVTPGQFLSEGEPIGAMGEASTGKGLYVELRQHNQPLDPGPWMRGAR